jgi:hypothetical protein
MSYKSSYGEIGVENSNNSLEEPRRIKAHDITLGVAYKFNNE